MKLESLLFRLKEAEDVADTDPEMGHLMADKALIEFINNPKVEAAYDGIVKYYA